MTDTAPMRVVMCHLKGDGHRHSQRLVEHGFRFISGIELHWHPKELDTSGAADTWQPVMLAKARAVLRQYDASMVLAGEVCVPTAPVMWLWLFAEGQHLIKPDAYNFAGGTPPDTWIDDLHFFITKVREREDGIRHQQ